MAYGDHGIGADRGEQDAGLFRQPITVPAWVRDSREYAEGLFDGFERAQGVRLDRGARDRLWERYGEL